MGIRIKDLQSGSPLQSDFLAFDGDGGTRKATVGAVIGAVSSNRNLIDNSWFTINQRGESEYNTDGYTVDRWYIGWSGIDNYVDVVDNGLMLYGRPNSSFIFVQILDIYPDDITGEIFTLSALCADGIHSVTGTINTDSYQMTCNLSDNSIMYLWKDSPTTLRVVVSCHDIDGLYLRAIKLEKGSTSTLTNDTVPNSAEELIRCITSHVDNNDDYANKKIATKDELSHRNLLDNGWFTINQRNVSGSLSDGYTVDRWQVGLHGGSITYNQSAHSLTFGTTTNVDYFIQQIEPSLRDELHGKVVTFSIIENDTIKTKTFTFDKNARNYEVGIPNASVTFWYGANGELCIRHRLGAPQTTIKAAKLELGSVSTLANDVAPNYAEELLKCQRYFWRLGGVSAPLAMMAAYDSNTQYGYVQFPVTMRATPTVSMSALSTFQVFANNANPSPTSMRVVPVRPQNGMIETKASGITAGSAGWLLTTASGGYINFSADL